MIIVIMYTMYNHVMNITVRRAHMRICPFVCYIISTLGGQTGQTGLQDQLTVGGSLWHMHHACMLAAQFWFSLSAKVKLQ
jgi:hypothetical protein